MAINVTKRLDNALLALLEVHGFRHVDGVPASRDDAACQAMIDAYDPLPQYQAERVAAIKAEGLVRIRAVFPALSDFDALDLERERWLSIASAARQPTTRYQRVIDIYTAGRTAIAAVNAATSEAGVDAVTPVWPV